MSPSYRPPRWLLSAGVLTVLTLTASTYRNAATTMRAPAPQAAVATARWAALPAHSGIALNYQRHRYIVQSQSAESARDAVRRAGGLVTADLSVIHAVAASLDEHEMAALRAQAVSPLHIYNDAQVVASSLGTLPETYYPSEVDAANLHVGGMTGRGVTVAVLDSGLWNREGPLQSAPGRAAERGYHESGGGRQQRKGGGDHDEARYTAGDAHAECQARNQLQREHFSTGTA